MTLAASERGGPLAGITVIDLTRVLAGPYCTLMLAELGARVIKVEEPGVGDISRSIGPFLNGKSAYFISLNRDKESIALNLKDDADRAVFEQLLDQADVLVENYRPGTMEKLGYGWDTLQARWPSLIFAAASGFGQTGPYAKRPAYDMVVQGMGGVMSLTGHPGGPPTRVGSSIGDLAAGMFAAAGINAALFERTRTGRGAMIDIGMLDCQVALLENAIVRYTATGEVPGPLGARHPSIAPFAAFTSGDGHIIVACGTDKAFRDLAAALGTPELADDARFATPGSRVENVEQLQVVLDGLFATKTTDDWLAILEAKGLPCGPINNVAQVMADPHVAARNMIVHTEDPIAGHVQMGGNPMKISGHPDGTLRRHAPDLDENRDALLAELAAAQDSARSTG